MVALAELVTYLDATLECAAIEDYCPNGLQVEGRPQVGRVVAGVSACQALLDRAVIQGADAVLVHHGYFWKGEDPRVVGAKRRRLQTLLGQGISLLAYHLPLDLHPRFGNNAQLGVRLGLVAEGSITVPGGLPLLNRGRLSEPVSAARFATRLQQVLQREPLHIGVSEAKLETVAWCTGAAQSYIVQAIDAGVDAYVTGEASEQTVHQAREAGIQFYAAGHHATERYGVQALGAHLAERYELEFQYVEIDNPV